MPGRNVTFHQVPTICTLHPGFWESEHETWHGCSPRSGAETHSRPLSFYTFSFCRFILTYQGINEFSAFWNNSDPKECRTILFSKEATNAFVRLVTRNNLAKLFSQLSKTRVQAWFSWRFFFSLGFPSSIPGALFSTLGKCFDRRFFSLQQPRTARRTKTTCDGRLLLWVSGR